MKKLSLLIIAALCLIGCEKGHECVCDSPIDVSNKIFYEEGINTEMLWCCLKFTNDSAFYYEVGRLYGKGKYRQEKNIIYMDFDETKPINGMHHAYVFKDMVLYSGHTYTIRNNDD